MAKVCICGRSSDHTRVSSTISNNRSSHPFHLIHNNVRCNSIVPQYSGVQCFVSFMSIVTRIRWLFLLKQKTYIGSLIPAFNSMIQNQFGAKTRLFEKTMPNTSTNCILFQSKNIFHDSSYVGTSQQDGAVERVNDHLASCFKEMLLDPIGAIGGSCSWCHLMIIRLLSLEYETVKALF